MRDHIARLRESNPAWIRSVVYIYVERNLGFEAEHHKLALDSEPLVRFRMDPDNDRVGIRTTQEVKHAMATLLNTMLREHRVHVAKPLVTSRQDTIAAFREQLNVYGYQFKLAPNPFALEKCVISGKVGGLKDDLCICLQLGIYFTEIDTLRAAHAH